MILNSSTNPTKRKKANSSEITLNINHVVLSQLSTEAIHRLFPDRTQRQHWNCVAGKA